MARPWEWWLSQDQEYLDCGPYDSREKALYEGIGYFWGEPFWLGCCCGVVELNPYDEPFVDEWVECKSVELINPADFLFLSSADTAPPVEVKG
jgi:hypothetical protein